MSLVFDEESRDIRGIDPMWLKGNLDILAGKSTVRLGADDGALFLWPAIGALAETVEHLRGEHEMVEADFIDGPSLWLFKTCTETGARLRLVYRNAQTDPVALENFDAACEQAAGEFLRLIFMHSNPRNWRNVFLLSVQDVLSVWPDLDRVRRPLH